MSATPAAAGAPHHSETVAVEAERRWAIVVGVIIAAIVLMMIVTGLHWAAMPPSRVETIDVKTLHLSGEFVEGQLGTTLDANGKVMVRLIAQQYSFEPQCIVVPAGMPVTFRGTATDAIHGFVVGTTNANTMLIPGFVATFTTTFQKPGE
ncbi:MAG: cytochrome C oxidase subunit II, partial [Hyphomicrobiaceae bacterium]